MFWEFPALSVNIVEWTEVAYSCIDIYEWYFLVVPREYKLGGDWNEVKWLQYPAEYLH